MANTPNFSLYKPSRADVNVEVDTSLADNFTKIDTELQNNKGGLAAHINDANAHTSDKITHADGSVKTMLDNHESQLSDLQNIATGVAGQLADIQGSSPTSLTGRVTTVEGAVSSLQTSTEGIDSRLTEIEVLGIDKLAPNLEGRITTLESDIEGVLAPATFDSLDAQNYTFDDLKMGYVNNKLAPIESQLAESASHLNSININAKYPFGTGLTAAKGDGVTDDYTALQAIWDYAATNNLNVFHPDGTYLISNSLYKKGKVNIIGAGRERTIFKKTTHNRFTTNTVSIGSGTYNVDDDSIINIEKDASFFTISDLTLTSGTYDGSTTGLDSNTSMTKYGMYSLSANQFTIRNVNTFGCKNGGYFLAPWKANLENVKCWRADIGLYVGYISGGASGTTTILKNCYMQTVNIGFSINGIGTLTLDSCSVDFALKTSYYLSLCNEVFVSKCSSERSGSNIIRLEGCNNVKVLGLRAYSVDANDPIYYKTAPIMVMGSNVIFENVEIVQYVNTGLSTYDGTKDVYNLSCQSSSGQPFNVKFVNCILPTNGKPEFITGDTNGLSSVTFYYKDGTQTIYKNISNAMFSFGDAKPIYIGSDLYGSLVWNPGSMATGTSKLSGDVLVTGARLGDYVLVAAPENLWGAQVTGYVAAADKVNIVIKNDAGYTINFANNTWKVRVVKG